MNKLNRTPLHDFLIELGAKMTEFAGWEMPIQFGKGIISEHLHVRRHAGLFDVSHMGQIEVPIEKAKELEFIIPNNLSLLSEGRMQYCVMTNEKGGIRDDLLVAKLKNKLLLIVNAALKNNDYEVFSDIIKKENVLIRDDRSLLALQGPRSSAVLERYIPKIKDINFLDVLETNMNGCRIIVSRSGYTGEDGFELYVLDKDVKNIADILLLEEEVIPIGLGARDSLRLEAGLCLMGVDLNKNISPVEAQIAWTIGKKSRINKDFCGSYRILREIESGPSIYRCGFFPTSKAIPRNGSKIFHENTQVGYITSGSYSPTLKRPIAMGYLDSSLKNNKTVNIEVRGKMISANITTLPFVSHNYFKGEK